MPRRALPSTTRCCVRASSACAAQAVNAASKLTTSSRLKTSCNVVAAGISASANPSARRTGSGCKRPHWLMAYRLRAPANMAAVANVNSADKA